MKVLRSNPDRQFAIMGLARPANAQSTEEAIRSFISALRLHSRAPHPHSAIVLMRRYLQVVRIGAEGMRLSLLCPDPDSDRRVPERLERPRDAIERLGLSVPAGCEHLVRHLSGEELHLLRSWLDTVVTR